MSAHRTVPAPEVSFDDEPASPARAVLPSDEEISDRAPAVAKVRHNGSPEPRTLPHSLEAERHVLSCILLEDTGLDTLRRCEDAGFRRETFYDAKHGAIFARMMAIRDAGQPLTVGVLAEELKAAGELNPETVAIVAGITNLAATSAQAVYFIGKVREQSILREIIRGSQRRIELAHEPSIDLGDFLDGYQRDARVAADHGVAGAAAGLLERAYDPKNLLPKPDRIYSIAGIPVCTPGNLTAIYSQAKTGKSSFLAAMMASAMTNPTSGHDTLGVEGPNYARHAVLHFDTEQSPYDWQQLVHSCLRRVGLTEPPPWLMSFTIAGMEAGKAERFVHAAMRLAKKTNGGVHSVFIDGVADLVNDPNSPDECFPLVARLQAMAIEYRTAVINILHLNPAAKDKNDKGRGHLGSQLERKCESNLTLKKDGDVTVVMAEGRQRGRPIPADKAPAFRWSDEHVMHVSTAQPAADETKSTKGRKPTHSFAEFKSIFPARSEQPKRMTELHRLAMQSVPIKSPSQFYNILQRFAEDGCIEIVELPGGRGYRLTV